MCNCTPEKNTFSYLCPTCGPPKFNPKVGEVYQTEDKRYKVRILAIDLTGDLPIAVAYKHCAGKHESVITTGKGGWFQDSKLIPFKEPKTKTVYMAWGHSGQWVDLPFKPDNPRAYLAYKKVTLIEGEYDE